MINITGGFLNIGIFVLIENVHFEKLLNLSLGLKKGLRKCSAAATSGGEKLNYVKVKKGGWETLGRTGSTFKRDGAVSTRVIQFSLHLLLKIGVFIQ